MRGLDPGSRVWPIGIAALAFLTVAAVLAQPRDDAADQPRWPREVLDTGAGGIAFVPDAICADCHADETAAWASSHHFHAMRPASEVSVLGDFGDVTIAHDGGTSRFVRRDGAFLIETDGPDGAPIALPVLYTFGVEPLQQYLVPMPGGRFQAYPIAWDTDAGRWFDLYPGVDTEPGHPLHWSGRLNNWNGRCAECHSTDLRTGFDLASRTFRTEWSAVNVGCQACHGPGEAHVDWARTGGSDAGSRLGLVVDYGGLDAVGHVETCARCHSRRHRITADDRHDVPFLDQFVPALLREDLYHADGQILDEVFVYGSFVQSRMYRAGVTCLDCHDAHSGRLLAEGNAVCTQCHNARPPDRFDGLIAADYDTPDHHHHEAGTDGAQCVSCHMPARTYMVVDPRRDHSLRVPRPDLSAALGAPNACAGCHVGQPAAWAADRIAEWTGSDVRQPSHYGLAIAAGRAGAPAAGPLSTLAQDVGQPALARATAIDLLRQYGVEGGPAIVAGLSDPEPLVRAASARAMALASPERRIPFLFPLLTDPVRAVRIEAARQLAPIPAEQMVPDLRIPFEAALDEYVTAQMAAAETPEAHLNLARMWLDRGQPDRAEESYRTAAELAPDLGDPPYALGLLLAEQGRLDDSAAMLSEAAERMPDNPRVRYNQALALQEIGRLAEAEAALLSADALAPDDADTLRALAILYAQQARWVDAERYAEALVRLRPGEGRLLRDIQQRRDR